MAGSKEKVPCMSSVFILRTSLSTLKKCFQLLPGASRGSGCSPSPHVILVHTRLIDHERCAPEQYHKCISYLLQTLGGNHRRPAAAAAAAVGRNGVSFVNALWGFKGRKDESIVLGLFCETYDRWLCIAVFCCVDPISFVFLFLYIKELCSGGDRVWCFYRSRSRFPRLSS